MVLSPPVEVRVGSGAQARPLTSMAWWGDLVGKHPKVANELLLKLLT